MNKKAYTLIESLLVLFILSILMLLSLSKAIDVDFEHYHFMDDYYLAQTKAFCKGEKVFVDYPNSYIYFNSLANINRANTIYFKKHKVIIHLGNGLLSYE